MAGRGVGNRGIIHFTIYRPIRRSGKIMVGQIQIGELTLHPIFTMFLVTLTPSLGANFNFVDLPQEDTLCRVPSLLSPDERGVSFCRVVARTCLSCPKVGRSRGSQAQHCSKMEQRCGGHPGWQRQKAFIFFGMLLRYNKLEWLFLGCIWCPSLIFFR